MDHEHSRLCLTHPLTVTSNISDACIREFLDASRETADIQEVVEESYDEGGNVEDASDASLGFVLIVLTVISTLFISYLLKKHKVYVLHDAGVALLVGVVVGFLVMSPLLHHLVDLSTLKTLRQSLLFRDNLFFLVLLPPIIFEAGLNTVPAVLKSKFWSNLDAIATYAVGGTVVTTVMISLGLHASMAVGMVAPAPFLHCLSFGTLIAATDPVTTLAVFESLDVNLDLYALVFGESVFNDAVSIVLYSTIISFQDSPVTGASALLAIGQFCLVLGGSVAIGIGIGVASQKILKHTTLGNAEFSTYEIGILIMMPYIAYGVALATDLSGIISVLVCGIVMGRHTMDEASPQASSITKSLYTVIARLLDCFVFIYIGIGIFTFEAVMPSHLPNAICSVILCYVARFWAVWGCTFFVNRWRTPDNKISCTFKQALWGSGLRGPISFALALSAQSDLKGDSSAILTSTIAVVAVTVWEEVKGSSSNPKEAATPPPNYPTSIVCKGDSLVS
eukprot:1191986-Prorocentrum_minimum.AAC.2